MFRHRISLMGSVAVVAGCAAGAIGQRAEAPAVAPHYDRVRAEIRLVYAHVNVGRPVLADLLVRNVGERPARLEPPAAPPSISAPRAVVTPGRIEAPTTQPAGVGLPLAHVFSGPDFRALTITQRGRRDLGELVVRPAGQPARPIVLAAGGIVGCRVDLSEYYSCLHRPGRYELVWRPYEGRVVSEVVTVSIETLKRVQILTDYGTMTVSLLYDKAPHHVANFLELAGSGFYNDKTFHRVIPGFIIQGGDPKGDGTGVRPDGQRLQAEFNDTLFELGTVGMARTPDDPNSASCQFFLCAGRQKELDGKYTAFGKLADEDSIEVLKRIAQVATDDHDRPIQKVAIRSVTVQDVPAKADR